jgi:hypothetical protein
MKEIHIMLKTINVYVVESQLNFNIVQEFVQAKE